MEGGLRHLLVACQNLPPHRRTCGLHPCFAGPPQSPSRGNGIHLRNYAVTVRSCRYFGPEVAAARRSVRPVPDRACGSASVRAHRVAMRFQCPTPFLTLAITPLRSASIAIWQVLRTAPYRHDRTVTMGHPSRLARTVTIWLLFTEPWRRRAPSYKLLLTILYSIFASD